jgi:hypothetical protein
VNTHNALYKAGPRDALFENQLTNGRSNIQASGTPLKDRPDGKGSLKARALDLFMPLGLL